MVCHSRLLESSLRGSTSFLLLAHVPQTQEKSRHSKKKNLFLKSPEEILGYKSMDFLPPTSNIASNKCAFENPLSRSKQCHGARSRAMSHRRPRKSSPPSTQNIWAERDAHSATLPKHDHLDIVCYRSPDTCAHFPNEWLKHFVRFLKNRQSPPTCLHVSAKTNSSNWQISLL